MARDDVQTLLNLPLVLLDLYFTDPNVVKSVFECVLSIWLFCFSSDGKERL